MDKQDNNLLDQLSRSGQLQKQDPTPESRAQDPFLLIGAGMLVLGTFFLLRRIFPDLHFATFGLFFAIGGLLLVLGTLLWFNIPPRK
jgi:hypothetical protein